MKIDTSKDNRRAITDAIGEQLDAWMEIRQEHLLAEQEIGHLQSLMLCLQMGEAGRIEFAERSLEQSRNLLARHGKLKRTGRKRGMARWEAIARSDQYGRCLIDAAMYFAGRPKIGLPPEAEALFAMGKELTKRRRE